MNESGTVRRTGSFRWQVGVTLVEILIVVVIVGLLTAAVVVTYSQYPKMQLREASRRLAGGVRFLSGRARTSRTTIRLVMDLDRESTTLRVEMLPLGSILPTRDPRVVDEMEETLLWRYDNWIRLDPADPIGPLGTEDTGKPFLPPLVKWEPLDTQLKKTLTLPNVRISAVVFPCMNKEFSSGLVSLVFYPNGSNWGAVIVLRSSGDHEMSMIVEPMTGKIRFESGFSVPDDLCFDADGNRILLEADSDDV